MNVLIEKWGDSLAVRFPSDLVERFNLKEGGTIDSDIFMSAIREFHISRKLDRDDANGR